MNKNYFPLFFKMSGCKILVVGGGAVAERKVSQLLNFGAEITLIAPEITERLNSFYEEKSLTWHQREYISPEARDYSLVIATTNDTGVNRRIFEDATGKNIPINVVDQPEFCTVFFPSIVNRGNMTFAIGSDGKAPFYTRALRKQLDNLLPPEITDKASLSETFRNFIMEHGIVGDMKKAMVDRFLIEVEANSEDWDADNPPLQTWEKWMENFDR